ncbi:MAG: hypothetical protein MUP21_05350 [Dehalococcoidia bacterium]|nr:hypothetical protein [Dehalococcoidia bacterium]
MREIRKIEERDIEQANQCVQELADVFMPIFKKHHANHVMMALAHIAASGIAAQKDVEAALDSHIFMLKDRTVRCVDSYSQKGSK